MSAVITVETIRPEVAAAYLLSNTGNRRLRPHKVSAYAEMMRSDGWHLTGDPIVFDANGRLIQGQHRLAACVSAEVPFVTAVMRDADPAAYAVMDSGMARQAADTLAHHGVMSANVAAAAARLVIGYQTGALHDAHALERACPRTGIKDEVLGNRDGYLRATRYGASVRKATLINQSAVTAFVVLADRLDGADAVDAFMHGLSTGVALEHGDPRIALRSWAINAARLTGTDHLSALIRAWNAYAANQPLRLIKRWVRGTAFPEMARMSRPTAVESTVAA